jgi:DNA-binding NtrC family response regulator
MQPSAEPLATVFVVDMEPYMVDVCTRVLQRRGYRVIGTTDPAEALRMIDAGLSFDLLLAAHVMRIRGLVIARYARAASPTVGAAIMWAGVADEALAAAIQSREVEYIMVPFELDALVLFVQDCLASRAKPGAAQRLPKIQGSEE